jgi:hypothetical protein
MDAIWTRHNGTDLRQGDILEQCVVASISDTFEPDAITVARNEMLYAFNQGDMSVLAIVLVNEDGSHEGPYYIRRPFDREPGWGVSSINYNLSDLLQKAESR